MDPDAAYEILNTFNAHADLLVDGEYEDAFNEMVTAWDALDQWLRKGGYLPTMWKGKNNG